MTVQEIIILASRYLRVDEEVEGYLSSAKPEGQIITETLLKYFNIVENELALDYLPLIAEDVVSTTTGQVDFSKLSKSAVRILSVKDKDGNSLKYDLFTQYLVAQSGELTIRYTYTPTPKGLYEEAEYKLYASCRMIAYGIVTQYYYVNGMFDEGEIWNKKYREAIAAVYRANPAGVIASRRWE